MSMKGWGSSCSTAESRSAISKGFLILEVVIGGVLAFLVEGLRGSGRAIESKVMVGDFCICAVGGAFEAPTSDFLKREDRSDQEGRA